MNSNPHMWCTAKANIPKIGDVQVLVRIPANARSSVAQATLKKSGKGGNSSPWIMLYDVSLGAAPSLSRRKLARSGRRARRAQR
jgi:hypothetical protein